MYHLGSFIFLIFLFVKSNCKSKILVLLFQTFLTILVGLVSFPYDSLQ